MPQFSRSAGIADVQLAVNDDADPIAGAKRDVTHVTRAASGPKVMLTYRTKIGIVFQDDRYADSLGNQAPQRKMVPSRQIGTDENQARWTIGVTGKAQADRLNIARIHPEGVTLLDDSAIGLLNGINDQCRLLLRMGKRSIPTQDFAIPIDQSGRDLGAAHIYPNRIQLHPASLFSTSR
jgi:hypothetical protein